MDSFPVVETKYNDVTDLSEQNHGRQDLDATETAEGLHTTSPGLALR